MPVYLDQNVFSSLQPERTEREELLSLLRVLSDKGAVFVYSMLHVEECRNSERPEVFADIIEELPAYLLESSSPTETQLALSLSRARELILADKGYADSAMRRMEDLLKPIHFAAGWLGEVEAQDLQKEITLEMDAFWTSLQAEMPTIAHDALRLAKDGMAELIRSIPMEKLRNESKEWQSQLRSGLPQNHAQLDAKPAEDVVSFLISCLDEAAQKDFKNSFPERFWAEYVHREEGRLTGFAFMLFMMGVVRDRRVKRGERKRREGHFLGQFRDCNHIELASRCATFVTFDEGAARLVKAVYSYAGAATKVLLLKMPKPNQS